jgi:hypothetical protein
VVLPVSGATLEYAEFGALGKGWYVIPHSGEKPTKHFDRYHAEKWAKERGYELTQGSPPEAKLVTARRGRKAGPFPSRYRVRALFAWLGYWVLTAVEYVLHEGASAVWRARWKLGVVMFDKPCPRCGLGLWSGPEGCSCKLVTPNLRCNFVLPPEVEIQEWSDRRELVYHVRLRRDLFHWARGHEFFGKAAIESMQHDDRLYREMSPAERSLSLLDAALGEKTDRNKQ